MSLDLDAIEKACEAATPGPWPDWSDHDLGLADPYGTIRPAVCPSDCAFIASARSWVPALIARVRELEADLSRRNDALASLTRLDEREACAELCDDAANLWDEAIGPTSEARSHEAQSLAALIRART